MQTTITIPGLHCASCISLIKDVSTDFPQIQKVDVDVDTKKVTIEHGDDFDLSRWTQAIESLGDSYRVTRNE